MKTTKRSLSRLSIVAVAFLSFIGVGVLMTGQPASQNPVRLPEDWSSHHLIFSNPGTAAEALRDGRIEQWYRIVNDPRYIMQQMKHNAARQALAEAPDFASRMAILRGNGLEPEASSAAKGRNPKQTLTKDWGMILGGTSTEIGTLGTAPPLGSTGQDVTIINGSNTLTLTLTEGTAGSIDWNTTTYITAGDTVTVGSTVYQIESSQGSCSSIDRCVTLSTTRSIMATNFANAIGGNCFNSTGCPGGAVNDPDIMATATTTLVDIYITTTGSVSLSAVAAHSGGNWELDGSTVNSSATLTQSVANHCTSSTAGTFILNPNTTTLATYLANAISYCATNESGTGVTGATSASDQVTVTENAASGTTYGNGTVTGFTWAFGSTPSLATPGPDQYPAKYPFTTTSASCTDFAVYNTGLAGSSSQPSIVAFDNLYSTGCSPAPSVYWAYNTGDTVQTSVVLSSNGSEVAFVDTVGELVLLRWASGTGNGTLTAPVTPNLAPNASDFYTGTSCATPCMYKIGLSGASGDTNSSPWYDYTHDILFVGDNQGNLHKINPVFTGAPAETISTNNWPATMAGVLTSPVYDASNSPFNVYVGSSNGKLYYVAGGTNSATGGGSATASATLTVTGSTGIVESPEVDLVNKVVYLFVNDSSATGNHAAVVQLAEGFTGSSTGTVVAVGEGATTGNAYSGTPDNGYFSTGSGYLYVCGRASTTQIPTLYKISLSGTTLGTPSVGPALATAATDCSPITEFDNTQDYIYLSVQANNVTTSTTINCPSGNGCAMVFDLTTVTWGTGATTSGTLLETGGTTGLIIDNSATSPTGASQVYFTTLGANTCGGNGTVGTGTGGCATQAAQKAL